MSSFGRARRQGDGANVFCSRRGSVAVNVAIMSVALIGMVSLGVEVSFLFLKQRQMQSAADSGAIAAASALSAGGTSAVLNAEADAIAAKGGFVPSVGGTTVTVNTPPTTGSHIGVTKAVEVIIAQPQALGLGKVFHPETFTVRARAVATVANVGMYCVFGLDPHAPADVYLANNAAVSNTNCGVATNSDSASALRMKNNSNIAGPTNVRGGSSLDINATVTGMPKVLSGGPIIADPYASYTLQTLPGGCTTVSGGSPFALSPGRYCAGWDFNNNVTVNLSPGTYYIQTKFDTKNNIVINGLGGVTLVLVGDFGMQMGNNLQMNLTAQASGPYAGLAIYSPSTNSPAITNTIRNNTILTVIGALYFPSQTLTFENNSVVTPTRCTQVIGRIVNLSNNVNLQNDCGGTGVIPIGSKSQLVE